VAIGRKVARIVDSADFQRVLQCAQRSRSPHFALHHLAARPGQPPEAVVPKLSTAGAPQAGDSVDDLSDPLWLGAVLPKRHARRAVTRALLRRQIRSAVERHASALSGGLWVVRLRAPFDVAQFPSAASEALRRAARQELDGLLARAAR
jgi:ribonuclease P protein component